MHRYRFRKPHPVPLLFIIAATLVLAGLGLWQLKRLQVKQTLLAEIAAAQDAAPLNRLPSTEEVNASLHFRRVSLNGVFLPGKTLRRVGAYPGISTGYYLLTPFLAEGARQPILVSRGFAPGNNETASAAEAKTPVGRVNVEGVLRPPHGQRMFAPQSDAAKNLWFYEDIKLAEKILGLSLMPLVLEQRGQDSVKEILPNPQARAIRNDHLGYALTWFALALVGLAMFACYHLERVEEKPE